MAGGLELGLWFRLAAAVLRPPLMLMTDRDWRGGEHLPREGGAVICSNHISYFDPLTLAHFIYENGRTPRFLAKASLFKAPIIGLVLKSSGQIPVYRDSADAIQAFSAAVQAVRNGHCVALYPEGTLTYDPHGWPMTAKTGAARMALATGAPVVPVAQWGPQDVLPPGAKIPRVFPRRTMHVAAGPPLDLSEFAGREVDAELLRHVSDLIMDAITDLLAEIRREAAPAVRTSRVDEPPKVHRLPRVHRTRRRSA